MSGEVCMHVVNVVLFFVLFFLPSAFVQSRTWPQRHSAKMLMVSKRQRNLEHVRNLKASRKKKLFPNVFSTVLNEPGQKKKKKCHVNVIILHLQMPRVVFTAPATEK